MSAPEPVTGGFRIRQASHADAEAIASMKARSWRQSYGELVDESVLVAEEMRARDAAEYHRGVMDRGGYYWVVVNPEGRIVGVAHAEAPRDADAPAPLELAMIYLLDEAKGTGIAERLMQTTLGDAPAYLWVVDDNTRARTFYEHHGFVADGATRRLPAGWHVPQEIRMVRAAQQDADA